MLENLIATYDKAITYLARSDSYSSTLDTSAMRENLRKSKEKLQEVIEAINTVQNRFPAVNVEALGDIPLQYNNLKDIDSMFLASLKISQSSSADELSRIDSYFTNGVGKELYDAMSNIRDLGVGIVSVASLVSSVSPAHALVFNAVVFAATTFVPLAEVLVIEGASKWLSEGKATHSDFSESLGFMRRNYGDVAKGTILGGLIPGYSHYSGFNTLRNQFNILTEAGSNFMSHIADSNVLKEDAPTVTETPYDEYGTPCGNVSGPTKVNNCSGDPFCDKNQWEVTNSCGYTIVLRFGFSGTSTMANFLSPYETDKFSRHMDQTQDLWYEFVKCRYCSP